MCRPTDGHAYQIDRLPCSSVVVRSVYPGALVADVRHFQQVGVQRGVAEGIAEDGLVGSRGAGGDHDPIETMLGDRLLELLLAVVRAGIDVVLGEGHVG